MDQKKGWRELAIARLLQASVRMERIHAQEAVDVGRSEVDSRGNGDVNY
ncbi:hypothetical protein [Paenibacillus hemerocallicola]|nr:hypothetical protein [Paenibacillus hemerocallicola]